MMKPNWFDMKYDSSMARATAEEWMEKIAADPTIVKTVTDALSTHDAKKQPGPSRSQAVRQAVCTALQIT
jgi:hypothetical protein